MFDCPMCHASYDVEDELAGQAIRCRHCGEWGRVPAPKAPRKPAPPPPAPPAPARPRASREPWYFDFIEGYAYITLAVGVVVGFILFVVAIGTSFKDGWLGFLGAVGAGTVALSGCCAWAVLLVLVDVGRSLRVVRRKWMKGEQR